MGAGQLAIARQRRAYPPHPRARDPEGSIIKVLVLSLFVRQQRGMFEGVPKKEDLIVLKELIEAGKVTPVIDRTYPLSETPEAIGYLGEGHARAKVVITV